MRIANVVERDQLKVDGQREVPQVHKLFLQFINSISKEAWDISGMIPGEQVSGSEGSWQLHRKFLVE